MDSLVNRGRNFETKYHHNQLHEFKILRARNRLLGIWIAETVGLVSEQQEALIQMMVDPTYCTAKGDQLIQKVLIILTEHGHKIPETHLYKQLDYCYQDAARDIITPE